MKKIGRLLVALLCLLLLVSCGSNGNPDQPTQNDSNLPDVVNIGVQTLVTPELIVRYENKYEEYLGTKVNLIQFDSGADVNRAFASGSIDIGAIGSSPAAIGISTGLGYEVIWYFDVIGSAESLAVKKDSGITKVEDLVGKKVATPFASTAHYSLQNAMALAGVEPSSVELYDMQPDDIFAAWTRGDIDAAYVWDPVLSRLIADNGEVITHSGELAGKGIVTADLCCINKEFAEKYPDLVANYIKLQKYGVDMFVNDHDKAVSIIADAMDISKEEAEQQVSGFIYPTAEEQLTDAYFGIDGKSGDIARIIKQAADFLVEQKSIDQAADMSVYEEYTTGEYIVKAINE